MITEKLHTAATAQSTLTLPFELRQKSRLRTRLDDGREVGLQLPRGGVLRDGDCLRADDGSIVKICAAPESVSTVRSADGELLARAAYHLGNRHVPLQVGAGWLRYRHDHVLDAMVEQLGLTVLAEQAGFEPEAGAYGGGHGHAHDHSHHDSAHEHAHDHGGHGHA